MTQAPTAWLLLILKRWKLLALLAIAGTAVGIAIATFSAKWYAATITVVQTRTQDSAAASLAARLPFARDAMSTDTERIRAVLASNSVTDEVIAKFELAKRYQTGSVIERARTALWSHCATGIDKKSGVISLTCEDTDPKLAMAMAAYFGEVGNKVLGRVSTSSAKEERSFLETQVEKARRDVEQSSKALRDFQEKYKIIDLPEQTKAVISAMASIKGDMISKQLELSYLSSFSSRSEASVTQLREQIATMESELAKLEARRMQVSPPDASVGSGSGSAAKAEFFPSALSVPELRFELERLMREQHIRDTVFGLLTQRFEMAKVDEARDTSTFQILDYPTLPTWHSRPKRSKYGLAGMWIGLMLALVFIVAPVWWRQYSTRVVS